MIYNYNKLSPIPLVARSKAWACGHSLLELRVRIPPEGVLCVVK